MRELTRTQAKELRADLNVLIHDRATPEVLEYLGSTGIISACTEPQAYGVSVEVHVDRADADEIFDAIASLPDIESQYNIVVKTIGAVKPE